MYKHRLRNRLALIIVTLLLNPLVAVLGQAETAHAQPDPELRCTGLLFSLEEDFRVNSGAPGGSPLISDGDLLSLTNFPAGGVDVCARNKELLGVFGVEVDLGLDAVVVVDPREFLIAFSTELDDPEGRFTAGDLLATNGAVIPNVALLANVDMPFPYDIGLDAIEFVGEGDTGRDLLDKALSAGRDALRDEPGLLLEILNDLNMDILFSTEGTGFSPEQPSFLDGDLLSVQSGSVVTPNADFLLPLPAGLPDRGVDYGLDAYTVGIDPIEQVNVNLFSTEIGSLDPRLLFTDGDVLQEGGSVYLKNLTLIQALEPLAQDLGLDSLDYAESDTTTTCRNLQITRVNQVPVMQVDLSDGYAQLTPVALQNRPFGNWIVVEGQLPSPLNCPELDINLYEFRLEERLLGTINWNPVPIQPNWQIARPSALCGLSPIELYVPPASDGWIPLARYWNVKNGCEPGLIINAWRSSGDATHDLRIVLQEIGVPATSMPSTSVRVRLDNTAPKASLVRDPNDDVQLTLYDSSGNELSSQCEITATNTVSDTIVFLRGRARDNGQGAPTSGDEHFDRYELAWTGGDVGGWDNVDLAPSEPGDFRTYTSGRPDLDDTGTLPPAATDVYLGQFNLDMEYRALTGNDPIKCGYAIRLRVWDRTIVGGFTASTNATGRTIGRLGQTQRTFCFSPAAPENL